MRFALLLLGLALMLAGCPSPTPRCSAATCSSGCCDATGACTPGTASSACGSLGNQCRVCISGELCNFGICTQQQVNGGGTGGAQGGGTGGAQGGGTGGAQGGGTGGANGGGTGGAQGGGTACNAGNCGGCCNGNVCEAGNSSSFCGANGNACVQCGGGLTCSGGQCRTPPPTCSPSNCNGCCSSSTVCETGMTNTACGTGGATCNNCGGNVCVNQQCVVPAACNAQNCPSGCCNGSTCMSGTNNTACGFGGNACTNCGANMCTNQQCVAPGCNAQTCPTGCCNGTQCLSGTSSSQCGSGGQACMTCVTPATCSAQACRTPDAGLPVGSACTSLAQCAGDNDPFFPGECLSPRLSDGGLSGWTGGYCSPTCFDFIQMNDCPSPTDYCDGFACFAPCTSPGSGQSNCRVGYVCALTRLSDGGTEPNSAHCIPNCNNAPQAVCGSRLCLPTGYCL